MMDTVREGTSVPSGTGRGSEWSGREDSRVCVRVTLVFGWFLARPGTGRQNEPDSDGFMIVGGAVVLSTVGRCEKSA